ETTTRRTPPRRAPPHRPRSALSCGASGGPRPAARPPPARRARAETLGAMASRTGGSAAPGGPEGPPAQGIPHRTKDWESVIATHHVGAQDGNSQVPLHGLKRAGARSLPPPAPRPPGSRRDG